MNCLFCDKCEISDNIEIKEFEKQLTKLKVDAYKWKILYKCKLCGKYWELRHYGGTHDENPHLVQVSSDYVKENWGINYLE